MPVRVDRMMNDSTAKHLLIAGLAFAVILAVASKLLEWLK